MSSIPQPTQLKPRPILCITIPYKYMQTKDMAALIIQACMLDVQEEDRLTVIQFLYKTHGLKYKFKGAMSEDHQQTLNQLSFAHWRELEDGQINLTLAQRNVKNDETGRNNRGIVCFGKARPDEFDQLGLSVANNAHATLDDFLECAAVQESLDFLVYLITQSPKLSQIISRGWNNVMETAPFMYDGYVHHESRNVPIQGLILPRWCFDHGICERSIMEHGQDEMDEDQE